VEQDMVHLIISVTLATFTNEITELQSNQIV